MSIHLNAYQLDGSYYGYAGPQPDLFLDKIPININFMGWQNLNMLPVYLPDVIQLKQSPSPGFHRAHPARTGFIEFISDSLKKGLQLSGNIYLGNETGDPGPWAYDSSTVTSNVDRRGIDGGGRISYRKGRWYTKGLFIRRNHKQTDNRTYRRLRNTMNWNRISTAGFVPYPIESVSDSWLIESGYQSERWEVRSRRVSLRDKNFIYLQPFGREVPAIAEYSQWAGEAAYQNNSWQTVLRYIIDSQELSRRTDNHIPIFDWRQQKHAISGAISFDTDKLILNGGVSVNHYHTEAPGIDKKNREITSLSVGAQFPNNDTGLHLGISTNVDFHQNRHAVQIRYNGKLPVIKKWKLKSEALYNELLPIHRQTYGYWLTQGYDFNEVLGIMPESQLSLTKDRFIGIQLDNQFQLSDKINLSLSQNLIHHLNINIPWQEVAYSPIFDSEPGNFIIRQESGTKLLATLSITYTPMEHLIHRLMARANRTVEGSSHFKMYFRQQPQYIFQYLFTYRPTSSMILNMKTFYRSRTYWHEFRDLEGQVYREVANPFPLKNGRFSSTVPSHIDISMSAQKYFWKRRFSMQFTADNLLNDLVQYHPIGADKAFIFHVKAVLSL